MLYTVYIMWPASGPYLPGTVNMRAQTHMHTWSDTHASTQVPKRQYTLEELRLNKIDAATLLSPKDDSLNRVRARSWVGVRVCVFVSVPLWVWARGRNKERKDYALWGVD